MDRTAHQIGPYSRPTALAKLDGRTKEAKLLQRVRDDLTLQLGGSLSATQCAMVERAAWLSLHVAQMDARMMERDGLSERDSRTYLAWSNSLARCLAVLNIKPALPVTPSLAELLARDRPAA